MASHIVDRDGVISIPDHQHHGGHQSVIALSCNPEFHKRTKHFNVKFHYQRAVLDTGEIGLQYVPTEEQAADDLTKPLGPTSFAKFL